MPLLWAGGPLHFPLPVAAKRPGSSVAVGELTSRKTFKHPLPGLRLSVPITVGTGEDKVSLAALVDSGAEDSLMDSELAKQTGLPLEALETPLPTVALNGEEIARITHRTLPVTVVVSGNHVENLGFLLLPSPQNPVVLGYPWLSRHNPQIDWSAGRIKGWSTRCHSECLRSARPAVSPAASPPAPVTPSDLSKIPSVYHDISEVFSKERALSLPPHRPYDCAIELLPGAPLPSSRLYNMSRPEREAMEEYIATSLDAGIIRPSTSPLGAGFFFVAKKDSTLRPCIDYRGLNQIMVRNRYPLPLIDAALGSVEGAIILRSWILGEPTTLCASERGMSGRRHSIPPSATWSILSCPLDLPMRPRCFRR